MLSTQSSLSMLGIFQIGRGLASLTALDARGTSSCSQTHQSSTKVQHGQYKGFSLLRIYFQIDSATQYWETRFTLKKFNPCLAWGQPVITNIKTCSSTAPIASTALHILGTYPPALSCFWADLLSAFTWVCSFGLCKSHPLCQLAHEPFFLPCSCRQCYPSIAFSPKQRCSHLRGKGDGNRETKRALTPLAAAGGWDITVAQEESKQPGWDACMHLSGGSFSQPYPFSSTSVISEK